MCTNSQLARVVRGEAERCGSFYVTERWLGGMLTNFQTIKKNIARLKELERGVEEGAFEFYTKKERLLLEREREKLDRYLSGIKEMTRLPGLVFVVDSTREDIAVREANRLGIPVVAIADTNADPDLLTIAIAGNDDAIRSVSLITRSIADVVEASRREIPEAGREEAESQAYTYSSDAGGVADAAGGSRRRRPRRKPRPEVIAQRLHHPAVIESADGGAEPAESDAAESDAKAEAADNPEPAADAGSEDAEAAVVGEVDSEEK
ncbi:MAG: 30S ribosomal protein S2 [Gemmatimonadales bacterium]|nr:30S ribosomal protein S2 [Gemmatimonadales bacterium]